MAFPVYESKSEEFRQGGGAQVNPTTDIAPPPGTSAGNLLIASAAARQTSGQVTVIPPAGWTEIAQPTSTVTFSATFWKLATGAEPASYTFTFEGPSVLSESVVISRYSNVSGAPIHASDVDVGVSDPMTTPELPTSIAEALLVRVLTWNHSPVLVTGPIPDAGTERWNINEGGGGQQHLTIGYTDNFAGPATAPEIQWTLAFTGRRFVGHTIAIEPDTAPQPAFEPFYAHPFTK